MQALIVMWIANSLESGVLQKWVVDALRILVKRTTNTVDDGIVDVVEMALGNKQVDTMITEAISKAASKLPA